MQIIKIIGEEVNILNEVNLTEDLNTNIPLIVIPHLDDELFSCFNVFMNAKESEHKEVNLLLLSYGESQDKRLSEYSKIAKLLGIKITIIISRSFKDSGSDMVAIKDIVGVMDKLYPLFSEIFIPELSHHQDHIVVHNASLAALRYRDSLSPSLVVYAYNYIYNHDFVLPNVYMRMNEEGIDLKIKCLKILDKVDNILSNRVNSEDVIRSLAVVAGSKIPSEYGESFRLVRMIK